MLFLVFFIVVALLVALKGNKKFILFFMAFYPVLPDYFAIELGGGLPLLKASRILLLILMLCVCFHNKKIHLIRQPLKVTGLYWPLFIYFAARILANGYYALSLSAAINTEFTVIVEQLLLIVMICQVVRSREDVHLCVKTIVNIPGCTMVFNNCLMRKIQERKPEFDLITMHDCWLYYICLGIGGKIISDKNAYIQYRQHGNNVIGAKRISIRKKIQMICQQNGSPRAKMIDEIIRLYGQDMKKEMLSKYKTFASYPKSIKAKNYFFKQSTENVFSTRELQKAKLRILFGSL